MASETDDTAVTEFNEENAEQTGLSGIEKKKEADILLLDKKSESVPKKVTKLQHKLERVTDHWKSDWAALDSPGKCTANYRGTDCRLEMNLEKKAIEESKSIEKQVQRATEAGQTVIKTRACKTVNTGKSISVAIMDKHNQHPVQQLNESHGIQGDRSRFLKALKVSTFSGDKQKFEDFWALFKSLVDKSAEPANLKMARQWQCLTGNALEAIRGLGVTTTEYEEAK